MDIVTSKMTSFRVRQVLDSLDKEDWRTLKQCIPKAYRSAPKDLLAIKAVFPYALKKALPEEEAYSMLGVCAESLLQFPVERKPLSTDITKIFESEMKVSTSEYVKALKSPTTQKFLDHIEMTRVNLAMLCSDEKLEYNRELAHTSGKIVGHPDIMTHTKILEVKTSTKIKLNWSYNVCQVLTYVAIVPSYTEAYLVFPLQEYLYAMDLSKWQKGKEFLQILLGVIDKSGVRESNYLEGRILRDEYLIGYHISKENLFKGGKTKTIYNTLKGLQSEYPWQLFLESNLVTKKEIPDEDVAKTLNLIIENSLNVYVHSPYTINLCTPHEEKDGYHLTALQKNLCYAKNMGMKGVVVHVGKSTTLEIGVAMENMKNFIRLCLSDATVECPLLLETPAGQGTEVLTTSIEFAEFINEINDPRLQVCVDTCHVFAAGELPSEYLNVLFSKGIIPKLVHFNDSMTERGSCRDCHEQIGRGKIGIEELRKCAVICASKNIPMLNE